MVLHLAPARLNRVPLWAVPRQEEQPAAGRLNGALHLRTLMRRQVIPHDYLAGAQCGDEHLVNKGPEDGIIGEGGNRHQRDQPLQREGTQERETLISTSRGSAESALPPQRSRIEARHARGDPGLINEDQVLGRDLFDCALEGSSLGRYIRAELLGSAERLFLRVSFSRVHARLSQEG